MSRFFFFFIASLFLTQSVRSERAHCACYPGRRVPRHCVCARPARSPGCAGARIQRERRRPGRCARRTAFKGVLKRHSRVCLGGSGDGSQSGRRYHALTGDDGRATTHFVLRSGPATVPAAATAAAAGERRRRHLWQGRAIDVGVRQCG